MREGSFACPARSENVLVPSRERVPSLAGPLMYKRPLPDDAVPLAVGRRVDQKGEAFLSLVLDARKPINSFVKLLQTPDGPSAETMRRRAARELYEVPETITPYGKIMEQTQVASKKGFVARDHLNIFVFLFG